MVSGRCLIAVARSRRGMSQVEVADATGVCARQLRRYEAGEVAVPYNLVRNIVSGVCGLDFIELQKELMDSANDKADAQRA